MLIVLIAVLLFISLNLITRNQCELGDKIDEVNTKI
jgi:hypothetical protein